MNTKIKATTTKLSNGHIRVTYHEPIIYPPSMVNILGKCWAYGWIALPPNTKFADIDFVYELLVINHNKIYVATIPSSRGEGKYKVSRRGDDYECECMGFKRWHNECRHIKEAKDMTVDDPKILNTTIN